MRRLNHKQQSSAKIGIGIATALFGLSGGLCIYPYIAAPSLVAFILGLLAAVILLFSVIYALRSK
jgi:hypothetical protein